MVLMKYILAFFQKVWESQLFRGMVPIEAPKTLQHFLRVGLQAYS